MVYFKGQKNGQTFIFMANSFKKGHMAIPIRLFKLTLSIRSLLFSTLLGVDGKKILSAAFGTSNMLASQSY